MSNKMPNFHCHKAPPKKNASVQSRYAKQNRKKKFNFRTTLWRDILEQDNEIERYLRKKEKENLPSFQCESKYIAEKLFPALIPAFQRMCTVTLKYSAHCMDVRFFDFLDLLAEILWNTNTIHPERRSSWKSIYLVYANQPFYRDRRYYKYRLFLTADEAATIIQSRIRGHQVRLKYNLLEMKDERRRIAEATKKQRECFNACKDAIVTTRDCVCKELEAGFMKQ